MTDFHDHTSHTSTNSSTDTLVAPATEPGPARRLRVVHLVFGVLFLGIVSTWALQATDTVNLAVNFAVVLPSVMILAGVAGLAAVAVNASRARAGRSGVE